MTVCVTGATGFVGGHLARELVERGERVRVTYRDEARLDRLRGLDVEPVRADVLDRDALRGALDGVDTLFHAAGVVGSGRRAWEVNAIAPRIAVEAAADAGVRRVVHTSSVVAIGPAQDGRPGREDDVYRGGGLGLVYVDSKHEGEVEAIRAALRRGVDLVMANPAYVIGVPLDRGRLGETSSRQVLRLARGEWPALVDGPTNVVDVRDVAAGHALVAERGRTGERYVLGGHNSSWARLAERLMELTGRAAPALLVPRAAARIAHVQHLLGLPPVLTGGIVTRLAAPNWQYVSDKAERELGYAPRPLDETLEWIAAWARELEERGVLDGAPPRGASPALVALLRAVERAGGPRLVVATRRARRSPRRSAPRPRRA
ncbi:MAG TPA: NAD-dependent epimerase/dehydratase family protein [Solirubrobacteraceae bacterium]|jgi:dihydroflavonol-4-reductase|nr:NAD-dependent epimerase/dehydratase family protein [Solirubrobacteraceae bacterium]